MQADIHTPTKMAKKKLSMQRRDLMDSGVQWVYTHQEDTLFYLEVEHLHCVVWMQEMIIAKT